MIKILSVVFLCVAVVLPYGAAARTWRVQSDGSGDAPTIQAAIDSASAGDLILVGPGRYSWTNQGSGDDYAMIRFFRGKNDFTVRGEGGPAVTILDAENRGRVLYFQGYNTVTVEGFTMKNGVATALGNYCGGAIAAHLAPVVVRDCVITSNSAQSGGGAWVGGWSTMRFENCEFSRNTAGIGGALRFINSATTSVVSGCLVTYNTVTGEGAAVCIYNATVDTENSVFAFNTADTRGGAFDVQKGQTSTVRNCTFADNSGPVGGGLYLIQTPDWTIENCIISRNLAGAGLSLGAGSGVNVSCTNIFNNGGGDGLPSGVVDLGGNFSLDPEFCGIRGSLNYNLQGDSPCASGNHPDGVSCGLIGAKPVLCGTVPVKKRTWGHIKSLYGETGY